MAASQLRALLNGPVVAGVGATVDAGLATDKFHVLPWDPTERIRATIQDGPQGLKLAKPKSQNEYNGSIDDIIKYAYWNVKNVLGIDALIANAAGSAEEFKKNLERDMVAIVFLSMAYGYYALECRQAKDEEAKAIEAIVIEPEYRADIVNMTRLNRAATFVLARMHTKYQTNHAIGGTPMQASIASTVRAFYGVSPGSAKAAAAIAQVKVIADALYWAVHPANETLLIPAVIENSYITETLIHKNGPIVEYIVVEEYFTIRARTPPASTHHFYVAAAAIKQLEPMGILPYMPEPTRTKDVVNGLDLIHMRGAALHPAAKFWGFDRITANQKLVESICADLGYAVRKLMPASSLAASPILTKEDALDSAWKGLIDAIRAAMDERGKDLLDEKVFAEIKKAIAPVKGEIEGITAIKRYLTTGATAEEDDDDDDDEEEEAEERGAEEEVAEPEPRGGDAA